MSERVEHGTVLAAVLGLGLANRHGVADAVAVEVPEQERRSLWLDDDFGGACP